MLIQTEVIPDSMWALLLGPSGLLVASVIVIVILWRKLNRIEKEHQEELKLIHAERHKDLAAGLRYREEVGNKLLEDNVEDRVTAQKMIEAMKSLSSQQEKADGTLQKVRESVQDIKNAVNNK